MADVCLTSLMTMLGPTTARHLAKDIVETWNTGMTAAHAKGMLEADLMAGRYRDFSIGDRIVEKLGTPPQVTP